MSAKEKNEMIIPDSKVESLFVELENIFDNYDGYDLRLKAHEIINAALYLSDGVAVGCHTCKHNPHAPFVPEICDKCKPDTLSKWQQTDC